MDTPFGEISKEKYKQLLEIEFELVGLNSKIKNLELPFAVLPQIKNMGSIEEEGERMMYTEWVLRRILADSKNRNTYVELYENYSKNISYKEIVELIIEVVNIRVLSKNTEYKEPFEKFINSKKMLLQT